jgi:L-threonylcarbamoyladenylate synthase
MINTEVQNAYEIIKKAELFCTLQIPELLWCHKWGGGQDLQTETKSRNPKHDRLDEWRKMMYNVFKDIPEVAWQIIDLSETQPL